MSAATVTPLGVTLKCFCRAHEIPVQADAYLEDHPITGVPWRHERLRCGPEVALARQAHCTLAPSKAHRWLPCPGSLRVLEDDPETVWAAEGTKKHAVLKLILMGDTSLLPGDIIKTEAGDYAVTKDVLEQCADVRDFIEQWRQLDGTLTIEKEIYTEIGHHVWGLPKGLCGGWVDAAAYNFSELLVLDAKFGYVRVEAKDNPQLYLYALGLVRELSYFPIERVTVCIAQPDYTGDMDYREHRLTVKELYEWAEDQRPVIQEILDGTRRVRADDVACRYCPARTYCPARLKAVEDFTTQEWMTAHKLEDLLPYVPRLLAIAKDLQQKAIEELNAGRPVPGFKLVSSKSKRRWPEDLTPEQVFERINGPGWPDPDLLWDKKLKSPAKVERTLKDWGVGKKDREKVVNDVAFIPLGGPKLVPASDPRPALEPSTFTLEDVLRYSLEQPAQRDDGSDE